MKKNILFSLLVLILFSCEGKRKPVQEPTVYNDDGIYSSGNHSMEEVNINDAGSNYLGDQGNVNSELLDPSMQGDDQLDEWGPVFFEFDQASLSAEARLKLTRYAHDLKAHSTWRILIEGHCDIRGTEAYNQALGEKRAEAVRRFLIGLGVESAQMNTISYGELKPLLARDNEEAWAMNRRAEFRIQK